MKVTLNETEVKEALTKYVRDNYLIAHQSFDVEVLDIMDTDGTPLDLDCNITVELGVGKQEYPKVTAVMPQAVPCPPKPY